MNVVRKAAAAAAALALMTAALPALAADDILATADKAGSFKTLISAVKAAGLEETLKGKGPLTVFAPTDEAFKKLPAGALETLLKPENKAVLASVLKYHVLPGAYSAERLTKAKAREYTVKTADGGALLFNRKDGLTVAGSKIAKADIGASNGTIHVIDAVLLPKSVQKSLSKTASAPAAAKPATAPAAAPAADAKKAEPAKPTAEPAKAPATKTEAPKAEAPKAEAPKADATKAEAPKNAGQATQPAPVQQPAPAPSPAPKK